MYSQFMMHGQKNFKLYICLLVITDIRRLTTGMRSEKRVVKRYRRCANVIDCA